MRQGVYRHRNFLRVSKKDSFPAQGQKRGDPQRALARARACGHAILRPLSIRRGCLKSDQLRSVELVTCPQKHYLSLYCFNVTITPIEAAGRENHIDRTPGVDDEHPRRCNQTEHEMLDSPQCSSGCNCFSLNLRNRNRQPCQDVRCRARCHFVLSKT